MFKKGQTGDERSVIGPGESHYFDRMNRSSESQESCDERRLGDHLAVNHEPSGGIQGLPLT